MDAETALRRILGNRKPGERLLAKDICRIFIVGGMVIDRRGIAAISSESRFRCNGQPPILASKGGGGYYLGRTEDDIRRWIRESSSTVRTETKAIRGVEKYLRSFLQQKSTTDQVELFQSGDSPPSSSRPAGPPLPAGAGAQ